MSPTRKTEFMCNVKYSLIVTIVVVVLVGVGKASCVILRIYYYLLLPGTCTGTDAASAMFLRILTK